MASKTITDAQIRSLRSEAQEAGDWDQVVLCSHALEGEGELDPNNYSVLEGSRWPHLRGLTVEQAREKCARVICEADDQD